jgi:hypothetical protein
MVWSIEAELALKHFGQKATKLNYSVVHFCASSVAF